MSEIKNKVTFKGNPVTLVGNEVKAGDVAPDFTVLSAELKEVKLSDYKGKVVVIAVFPSSDHKELDFGTKYGFVIKELRLLSRGTVIVDKDGIIRYVEYVPEIGEHPDYEKALEVIKELV